MDYGGCSRFWYSGCEGNENRFETNEECHSTCVQPSGKDVCKLQKHHGPCTAYLQKYYYDSDRNICSPFIYGGCLGNENRFETLKECQQQCVVDESLRKWWHLSEKSQSTLNCNKTSLKCFLLILDLASCEQPLEEGPCSGNFERWYFDKESDACRPFRYGGCKGTKNNFASEQACLYQCKNPTVQKGKLPFFHSFRIQNNPSIVKALQRNIVVVFPK